MTEKAAISKGYLLREQIGMVKGIISAVDKATVRDFEPEESELYLASRKAAKGLLGRLEARLSAHTKAGRK